ncbi:MAG TPA: hypothetical protein VIL85_00545 [Thermomicrobiales bacterium]
MRYRAARPENRAALLLERLVATDYSLTANATHTNGAGPCSTVTKRSAVPYAV